MVAVMHKNRPVRMIHFGLKMRDSGPVKLVAKANTPIGNLGEQLLLMGNMERKWRSYMCMIDDITDQWKTSCHRVVKMKNNVLNQKNGKSETAKRTEKLL